MSISRQLYGWKDEERSRVLNPLLLSAAAACHTKCRNTDCKKERNTLRQRK
jgi:hypothetical protein